MVNGGPATALRLTILGPAPPDRGGIAHETARLAQELERLASVQYLTFSRPYPRWLDPRRFAADRRLSPAPAAPALDYLSPRSWRGTALRVADWEADALVVPWWTAFWAIPMRTVFRSLGRARPGTLRTLLCHNVTDHEAGMASRFLALGALSAGDAFLTHNETDRARLARRFPGRPTAAVPLPALENAVDRNRARVALGIQGPLVLFLGLVRPYKGVDVLLAAAPRIVHETGAQIAVVGEVFDESRDLVRLWESSPVRDRIVWKDEYVSEQEMASWLAACDVVVLPYRRISSSAIAARAIGARRPIAAAAVGGLREAVQPGVTGETFPAGDPDALAHAVARILARGTASYAPGLERAARETSWPIYAEKIVAFLESCRDATSRR